MPKLVELYGTATGISDGSSAVILSWQVPTGYVAELVGIGIKPDWDGSNSYIDTVQIAAGTSETRIGKIFEHSVFSVNKGKNVLSFGSPDEYQPLFEIAEHGNPHSLTYKFVAGKYIQIVGTASGGTTGEVKARARVILYEEDEVPAIFGVPADRFATLPGGHDQDKPTLFYAEVFDNEATSGGARWEDVGVIDLQSFEYLSINKIGTTGHANADALKIYDTRTKEEIPDREPYWKVNANANVLPIGDAEKTVPMVELPDFVKGRVFNNTSLKIQVRDTGTAIPAGGLRVQVFGTYMVR